MSPMKKIIYTLIVLLIAVLAVQAQKRVVRLLDAVTNAPISYAQVFLSHTDGFVTDADGLLMLSDSVKSVRVGHIAYEVKVIDMDSLIRTGKHEVYVPPVAHCLSGVDVVSDHAKLRSPDGRLVGISSRKDNIALVTEPFGLSAIYIPYDSAWVEPPIIKGLFIHASNSHRKGGDSDIAVCYLVRPDASGAPSDIALTRQYNVEKSPLVTKKGDQFRLTLDEGIRFPKEGVFLVFYSFRPNFSVTEWRKKLREDKWAIGAGWSYYISDREDTSRTWRKSVFLTKQEQGESAEWRLVDKEDRMWKGFYELNENAPRNLKGGVVIAE